MVRREGDAYYVRAVFFLCRNYYVDSAALLAASFFYINRCPGFYSHLFRTLYDHSFTARVVPPQKKQRITIVSSPT